MNVFRIKDGPVQMGPGTVISLDKDQLAVRSHRVRALEKTGARTTVMLDEVMSFKTGEVIGIANPEKRITDKLEIVPDAATRDGPKTAAVASGKGSDRKQRIILAIGKLNPEDRRHFRSDGLPAVAALEKVLGFNISAAERDAAWTAIRKK